MTNCGAENAVLYVIEEGHFSSPNEGGVLFCVCDLFVGFDGLRCQSYQVPPYCLLYRKNWVIIAKYT